MWDEVIAGWRSSTQQYRCYEGLSVHFQVLAEQEVNHKWRIQTNGNLDLGFVDG